MSKSRKDYFLRAAKEILKIIKIVPSWSIKKWIEDNDNIDITNGRLLYDRLKTYRENLEINKDVIVVGEELDRIVEEGKHIHRVIIKERLYGNEEETSFY